MPGFDGSNCATSTTDTASEIRVVQSAIHLALRSIAGLSSARARKRSRVIARAPTSGRKVTTLRMLGSIGLSSAGQVDAVGQQSQDTVEHDEGVVVDVAVLVFVFF